MTEHLHGHAAPHVEHIGKGVEKGISGGIKGVWEEVEKHWVWYAVGAGALLIAYLILNGSSSSSGSTLTAGGAGTGSTAASSDIGPNQAAVDMAQIAANGQALQAKMQLHATNVAAAASATSAQIAADSQDYIQTVDSGNQTSAELGGILASQNVAAIQGLASGFGSYMSSTAQEVSSVAGSVASTASSNNQAATAGNNPLQTLLDSASLMMGTAGNFGIMPSNAARTTGLAVINSPSNGISIGGIL